MNRRFPPARQAGFTLIELVVVILILGILSATALQKYTDLSGDARVASLKAAKGAIASAAAMAHAAALANPTATTYTAEGVTVTLSNGYPAAGTDADARKFAELAGLSASDYDIDGSKGDLAVSPKGVSSGNRALCFVTYEAPNVAGRAPRILQAAAVLNCN